MGISTNTLRKIMYVLNQKAAAKYVMAKRVKYSKHKGVLIIDTIFGTFYIVPKQLEKRTLGYIIHNAWVPVWVFGIKIPKIRVPFKFSHDTFTFYSHQIKLIGTVKVTVIDIIISEEMLKSAKEK